MPPSPMDSPGAKLLRGGRIWNGRDDDVVDADLLVEGGVIRQIAPRIADAPTSADVIDASGATIIPSMVEAHGHLSFPEVN